MGGSEEFEGVGDGPNGVDGVREKSTELPLEEWVANPDPEVLDRSGVVPKKKDTRPWSDKRVKSKDAEAKHLRAARALEENRKMLDEVLLIPEELAGTGQLLVSHARAAGARYASKQVYSKALGKIDGKVDEDELSFEQLLKVADISGKYGLGTKIEVNFGQHELLAVFSRVAHKYIPDPEEYEKFARECFSALQEAGMDKAMGADVIEAAFEDQSS
jgi:hypothetical protein